MTYSKLYGNELIELVTCYFTCNFKTEDILKMQLNSDKIVMSIINKLKEKRTGYEPKKIQS